MDKTAEVASGYVRVSTDEQARSGLGLDAQRAALEAYCTMRGLDLTRVHADEGVSAGRPLDKRPGGAKLCADVEKRRCRHVVVMKLDRAWRNTRHALGDVDAWEKRGVTLHVVDLGGNSIDTRSAAGRFMLTVLAAAAEMERGFVSERTQAALAAKRKRGEKLGGAIPYGYALASDGKLSPRGDEQATLAAMREIRDRGLSLTKTAAELNAAGWRTRCGKPWNFRRVHEMLRRA